VIPFGLTNAPATFIDLKKRVFNPYLGKLIILFIGYMLVYSMTPEGHAYHSRKVLEVFRKHELYVKFK